jgi:hypothetical protein
MEWKDTLDTLHMYMQVVGKVKLKLYPFINHWWGIAFHLTASGMTTGVIPYENEIFEVDFDFIDHNLYIKSTNNKKITLPLYPRSVSDFYHDFMSALKTIGINIKINPVPTEVADPIRCDVDIKHCSYDKEAVKEWWHILLRIYVIFERFRTPFYGKSSPIHFFWGSFDLNGARFSGRPAEPPSNDIIMRFAENRENFAFGFWAGNSRFPNPAFYTYIYPPPKGIDTIKFEPDTAYYDKALNEFILLYDDIRKSSNPEKMVMDFLQSTYSESAKLAGWDIQSLEGPVP